MDSTANDLFNLLVSRDYTVKTLTNQGKPETNPGDAEMFSFDFETSQNNYGTVVILLDDEGNFEVYYGDNVGKNMEGDDKDSWYDFLNQLKTFATRNLLTFTLKNLNKLKYSMQGMAAINEGLFEGWNGTKRTSYNDKPGTTRLKIVHSRELGEGEQRFRNIEKLYVENTEGERFKLPFTTLVGGRAMARHVAEGGTPYDVFGQHITDLVREANILNRFVRTTKTITEDDAEQYEVVSAGRDRYQTVRSRLKSLAGKRGYHAYKESWDPAVLEQDSAVVDALRGSFITKTVPTQIEEALPYIAQNLQPSQFKEPIMKEFDQFANWAENVTEGTWAIPDDEAKVKKLKEILAEPLPVGVDAMNATNVLYDIIGDDELFDRLSTLADQDPEADARSVIGDWIEEYSDSYPGLEDLAARVFGDTDSNELEFEEGLEEGDVIQGKFGTQKMNKYGMSAVKTAQGFFALKDGKVVAGPFETIDELKSYQEGELNKEAVGEQLDIDTGEEQRRQERDHMLEMNTWRKLAGMPEKVYEDFTAFQEVQEEKVEETNTPLRDREDFLAKSKHLYNLMMDPNLKDQESMKAIQQRILDLEKEARALGLLEMTEDDRAAKLNDDILNDFDEGNDAFSGALEETKARITARKYEGDDAYSWAVFIDDRPMVTGLTKSQVPYYKRRAQEIVDARGKRGPMTPGTKKTDEGNAFSGALAKAKASGAAEFEVDGKRYKVTEVDAGKFGQQDDELGMGKQTDDAQIVPGKEGMQDEKLEEKKTKKAKPDYLDFDKDGDRKESMKKALADKKKKKTNEEDELDEEFKKGDKVHLGLAVKGGTGIRGTIEKIEGDKVYIINPEGRKYSGQLKNLTKESINEAQVTKDSVAKLLVKYGNNPEAVKQMIEKEFDRAVSTYPNATASKIAEIIRILAEESNLDERSLTKGEEKKKEKYVKGMKKSKADFKKRYGDRGEEVMYATATKMAKEGEGETTGESNMFGKGIYESLTELENDLDLELGHGITATSQLDRPENPVGMLEPEEVGTTDIAAVAPAEPKEKNIGDKIADKGMELSASIDAALADIKRLAGMGN